MAGASARPLSFTVRGQPVRKLALAVACFGLLCAYGYAVINGLQYAAALLPSRYLDSASWLLLVTTLALVVISAPVAALLARFGGRYALLIAGAMTLALLAVLIGPTPFEDYMEPPTTDARVFLAIDCVRLFAVLPLLVWLLRRLPSNNRWRGP